MAYLGEKQQSEAIRFHLTLDTAPTGTPQVAVEKQGSSILAATNMTQGPSNLEWYYDYATGAGATIGAYQVKYSAVLDGTTRYAYDEYDLSLVDVDDIPTTAEIDAQLISSHGSGSWVETGTGQGAYNATVNVKDDTPANVANAYVTVHNSNDDDSPLLAAGMTDAQGNVTLNIDGSVYVRVKKAGFNFTSTNINITATGTYNVTGTALTYSAPTDPELCRLYLYPITLDNQDVTSLVIKISSQNPLTKVNGEFIKATELQFTYDSTTTPDSYYFDAVQGALVQIACEDLGINTKITVPAEATKDLNALIT